MWDWIYKDRDFCAFCGEQEKKYGELCLYCYEHLEFIFGEHYFNCWKTKYILFHNTFLRNKLHAFKFYNKTYLAKAFARLLYDEGMKRGVFDQVDGLVPVPMTAGEQGRRGYNQVLLIGEELSRLTKIPLSDELHKIRETKGQHRLSAYARRKNLTGAFQANSSVQEKFLLVLDDFVTTGNTMAECRKALEEQGAKTRLWLSRPLWIRIIHKIGFFGGIK